MEALYGVGSATITPETGGELLGQTEVSEITVSFPPGAVTEPVVVTFRTTSGQPAPEGLTFLDQAFVVEAETLVGTPVTSFSQLFTMTVAYDETGLAETALALYTWHEDPAGWDRIPSAVDPEANLVTAYLDYPATFAVLGQLESGTRIYLPVLLKEE